MPSKAVDEAWHEMILMTREYTWFCQQAFGHYLHHSPESTLDVSMDQLLAETIGLVDKHDLPMVLFTADTDARLEDGTHWHSSDLHGLRILAQAAEAAPAGAPPQQRLQQQQRRGLGRLLQLRRRRRRRLRRRRLELRRRRVRGRRLRRRRLASCRWRSRGAGAAGASSSRPTSSPPALRSQAPWPSSATISKVGPSRSTACAAGTWPASTPRRELIGMPSKRGRRGLARDDPLHARVQPASASSAFGRFLPPQPRVATLVDASMDELLARDDRDRRRAPPCRCVLFTADTDAGFDGGNAWSAEDLRRLRDSNGLAIDTKVRRRSSGGDDSCGGGGCAGGD